MPCYEFNFTSNVPQLLPDVWVPCPAGDNCCIGLDTCMSNNICRDYGAVKARSGSYSSYYNARCTDPTYTSPACDKICIGAPPDIVYNYTSEHWACCGLDKSGLVSCNAPIIGEYYDAPAPGNLSTLSAGAVYISTATLTPVAGDHPTTYSFTTPSTLATGSSSSSALSASSSSSTTSTSSSHSPTASADSATSTKPTSLSGGAKAGIGIGIALGVIAVVALLLFFLLRHRRRKSLVQRHDPARQHMIEMPSNPLHARVFEKDALARPPVELENSDSDRQTTEPSTHRFSYQQLNHRRTESSTNGFSFLPSIR